MQTTTGKEIAQTAGVQTPAEQHSPEMSAMQATAIGKFGQASQLELSEKERAILFAPLEIEEILTKPGKGGKIELYMEWGWYADRLDRAFGPGDWALTPAPWNPRIGLKGNIVYGEYVLWIRGKYVRRAFGQHEETRETGNFGDAAESTEQDALKRCCKKMGMARDLWRKNKREVLKQRMKAGARPAPPETIEVAKQHTGPESPLQAQPLPDSGPLPSYKELIDAIKAELLTRWPSQNNADSAAKKLAIVRHFGGTWNQVIEMRPEDLTAGLQSLRCEPLEAK